MTNTLSQLKTTGRLMQRRETLKNRNTTTPPVVYRVSKLSGRFMVAVAFLLDMLPIVLAVVILIAVFSSSGSAPPASPDTPWYDVLGHIENIATLLADVTSGAFIAAVAILIATPAAFFIGSLLAPLLAFMIFTMWFLFKRVNPFSLTGSLAMLFEFVPILNLFLTITFVVWLRVRASQKEDELRFKPAVST